MKVQFKTADNSLWEIDNSQLTWRQVTDDPENPNHGVVAYQGNGHYSLTPRTADSPAPGAGLCWVFVATFFPENEEVLQICGAANVPIKDLTVPNPIKRIEYVVLSSAN